MDILSLIGGLEIYCRLGGEVGGEITTHTRVMQKERKERKEQKEIKKRLSLNDMDRLGWGRSHKGGRG